MSWNYRVVESVTNGETSYGIHEVYYDAQGNITGISAGAVYPEGTSHNDLRDELWRMLFAYTKPMIRYDTKTERIDYVYDSNEQSKN